MNIDWSDLQQRRERLIADLARPDIDVHSRAAAQKELSRLEELLQVNTNIQSLQKRLVHAEQEMTTMRDPEMHALYTEEVAEIRTHIQQAEAELEELLYPPDPLDDRSVFVEVRAGTGGQEAALFATDLAKMYTLYAQQKRWRVEVDNMSETDLGGAREIVLFIKGKGVYGHLKQESGVHRVQRVPQTETQGRVHTSTATVAVMPEAEDVDVKINPADLRIDVYRSSGAGGQHVNTTDSAVRITHIPTGVAVACQDERSQHKNKAKAMKMLQARILAAQVEAQHAEMAKLRKEQVGTGQRAEKVRTYNYPQNRVTDHQVDVTLSKLDMVMQGDLDQIIQALRVLDRERRKETAAAKLESRA